MKQSSSIILSAGVVALFLVAALIPSLASSRGDSEIVECGMSNILGTTFKEKSMPSEKIDEMENKIAGILNADEASANISRIVDRVVEVLKNYGILPEKYDSSFLFGKTWSWGVFNYIISYGRGETFVPLKSDRSFVRMMFRPIFFNYNAGITIAKFGTNYMWDSGSTFGNIGWMFGRQRGFTVGFIGIHIRIPHALHPDSHLFIGTTLILNGNNLLF